MGNSAIGLGDLHLPWADRRAIKAAIAYIKFRRPRYVVQLGDLYDWYSATRFPRSLNVLTPAEEFKRGRAQAEEFWAGIRAAAGPKCELLQILGNHDDRPIKRVLEKIPDLEHVVRKGLENFWTFDGVKTVHESIEELILEGVLWTHGHLNFGQHITKYRMPVVTGHLHKGDLRFERISIPRGNKLEHRVIWEANAGYLGNPFAIPLRYRALKSVFKYTQGLFELDEFGPRFIPLEAA